MKVGILAIAVAALGVLAIGFAVHFELSARARASSELRGLRAQTSTELDHHLIGPSRAAALDSELGRARRQIERDDVRGAQRLLDGVKADLRSRGRSA